MLPREGRPPTKRRVDYRPPAFCIDTLHLTFDLDPEATEVTAVLALEIVSARGPSFSFLPAVAFTVVVLSNLFVVWGSIRAANVVPVAALVQTPVAAPRPASEEPASKAAGAF